MAGGDEEAYQKLNHYLRLSENVSSSWLCRQRPAHKMANQIMIAGTMTGMTEMLVYADKAGLELPQVIETLSGGSAANWSLANYSPVF